nr:hypothetical protein [Hyphomonas sp. Mor2]
MRLRHGRMHEVRGAGADMFAVLAAAAHGQPIVWMGLHRDIVTLNPTGLQAWLKVEDVILVEAVSRGELLWAADQALRAAGGFCVILDMPDRLSLKESRRLQLAAEQGGGIGLMLLRGPASTSAAQTRWDCQPCCTDPPSWEWVCVKGKNGETGRWRMTGQEVRARRQEGGRETAQNAKNTLHLAATASA